MIDEPLFSVAGKVVAVTGGSSGIGQRMVETLSRHGAKVVSISRTPASAPAPENIDNVLEILADVTCEDEILAAFDAAEARFGPVSVVFNNAGVAYKARAIDTTRAMLEHVFAVNVAGAFFVAQEAARRMMAAKIGGSIINTTSILSERPQNGAAAYAMSKAAITQMTRALALEWASHDIRVNAIAPGWFPTRINEPLLGGPAAGFFKARNPMRRLGQPDDLDGIILMLASSASRYMTGTVVTVDGGHSLQS